MCVCVCGSDCQSFLRRRVLQLLCLLLWSCREFVFFNRKNSRPLARELEAGEEKNYALHFDAYIVYVSTSRSLLTSLNLDMCGYGNTPDGLYTMCCLLVLDSVTSTPQWIRQPRPRVYLHDDDVFYLFLQKQNLGAKLHIYL